MTNMNTESLREMAVDYVAGTLTLEEMVAVDQRMAIDEALRREVEAARRAVAAAQDWLDGEAPGAERADVLAAPSLKSTSPPGALSDIAVAYRSPIEARRNTPQGRRLAPVLQIAAAAAIFAIGFWLGTRTGEETVIEKPATSITQQQDGQPASAPDAAVNHISPDQPEVAPSPTPSLRPAPPQTGRAMAEGPQYKTDDQGRLIIETMLGGDESVTPAAPRPRAIVVVDGGFRLNQ